MICLLFGVWILLCSSGGWGVAGVVCVVFFCFASSCWFLGSEHFFCDFCSVFSWFVFVWSGAGCGF